MISIFKKKTLKLFYHVKWWIQSRKLIRNKYKYKKTSKIELCQPSLLIVPHADDELIGCYSLISGHHIKDVVYCRFSEKEMGETRLQELKEFLAITESNLYVSNGILQDDIWCLLKKNKYNSIFLPSPLDWHYEHRCLSHLLLNIISYIPNYNPDVYLYSITVPHCDFGNLRYGILSDQNQKKKWGEFVRCYKSQLHLPIRRFQYKEKIQGSFCSQKVAVELFMKLTIDELRFFYSKCKDREKYLDKCASYINDLERIFQISQDFSKNLTL